MRGEQCAMCGERSAECGERAPRVILEAEGR